MKTNAVGGIELEGMTPSEAKRVEGMTPQEFRMLTRRGEWPGPSRLACRGYAQASIAIVPKEVAFDFLVFCIRNPRPCPVMDVTQTGNPHPPLMAPEADVRTDLGKYRVYKHGELVAEPTDIMEYWRDDLITFILGCGNGFDWCLRAANIKYRKLGAYLTNIQCVPSGPFSGPMVVSCRLVKGMSDAIRVVQITSRLLASHGPPIHIGEPAAIGIKDFNQRVPPARPREPVAPQEPDEVAMYWGCAVTPEAIAIHSRTPLMITNRPGKELVTDKLSEELTAM